MTDPFTGLSTHFDDPPDALIYLWNATADNPERRVVVAMDDFRQLSRTAISHIVKESGNVPPPIVHYAQTRILDLQCDILCLVCHLAANPGDQL